KEDPAQGGARGLLPDPRNPRPQEEALHVRAPRLAQVAACRGHSAGGAARRHARGDPAALRGAPQERAGRAPLRAPRLHGAPHRLRLLRCVLKLRAAKIPVTLTEFLTLLEALRAHLAHGSVDEFYYLARATLVKDETHYDRFDRVFGEYIKGIESVADILLREIPAEWLRKEVERLLTDEEKAQIKSLGGFEQLLETLRKRLEEQKERHQGGSKWIGTAGTSPFGAYGYNPEGIRIGQDGSRQRRAV